MSTINIVEKVRNLKELKSEIEELEAEARAIEDELKAEMTDRNTEELQADIFTIRYKPVKSNRFDSKAFKETHSDLYKQYTKATEYKRFSIA